ncbi:L-threonine dehydratase catabolic TdcB [bacterium BMS3Abin02]|nr:L-threonine dehydratase catabolic TdcB [bacterium BMS3Abin02]GBE21292.1 L-threonine dehydratase catabolic TdcB [bacterium BMS3Bbin01]HDH25433.1 threonine ammonia-lyase [Actinomycetota bacterium]
MTLLTIDDILAARERQRGSVIITPLLHSASFSRMASRNVWLKAENLQRTGSFKIRGASNVIGQLTSDTGVVAGSAGNHAQGVALAAQMAGIPATIFMPRSAAIPKVEATRSYGADVRLGGEDIQAAVEAARRFADENGALFIHPFDDPGIIAGQGTLGLEIIEQLPDTATVVVPIGGGGLISGTGVAIKALRPDTRIVGVEIESVAPYLASRNQGRLVAVPYRPTVADGIAVPVPSPLAYAHIEEVVDDIVTVDDRAAARAVMLLLERAKLVVEGAGSVGVAALLEGMLPDTPDPCVIVLSGGNIDPLLVGKVLRYGLEAAGRYAWFRVLIPDIPGQLATVLNLIADLGANVLTVNHRREGAGLPFGTTELGIAVETVSIEQTDQLRESLQSYEQSAG